MKRSLVLCACLTLVAPLHAFDLKDVLKGAMSKPQSQSSGGVDALSSMDINDGLKEALTRGAEAAVGQLREKDGFFGSDTLRIPLPPALEKADRALRMLGMGKQTEDLLLAINRAAEAAVPEAQALLVDAVKGMTLEDAKGVLTGGKTSATDFFRKKTETPLTERFLPVVKGVTDKSGLAQQYNQYAGKAAQLSLVDKSQTNVEEYVTQMALDRLFNLIGENEAAIRANPLGAGSDLLGKVFGAVGGK